MKLVKFRTSSQEPQAGVWREGDEIQPLGVSLSEILESDQPAEMANKIAATSGSIPLTTTELLAPIDQQEVWAAGVTYKRSQAARMEESEAAADCYDRVYASARPEIFFKATPHRVSGPGQPLRIRVDSEWNVPEPELTLVMNSRLDLVGFTIGNDMSSRDIEGENPLYLPQAKVYDACCGLGPCITLAEAMPPTKEIGIRLTITRNDAAVFAGETSIAEMARSFGDLIEWLGRDQTFPQGVMLLTGTGIIPDNSFTLRPGDVVAISIDGVGDLVNTIVQGDA
ncbi:MAG: fumarylacetoacetate hydrolase family protein [bacterium]|nr:fumarylacetoacetate hydrolase family protein [bacterium]